MPPSHKGIILLSVLSLSSFGRDTQHEEERDLHDLTYHLIWDHPALRISPLGCVPQQEQRPWIINDYTFSQVNPASHKLAADAAMQCGRTLHQVLWFIYNADCRHGPVLLSKLTFPTVSIRYLLPSQECSNLLYPSNPLLKNIS